MTHFNVYVIHSAKPVSELKHCIETAGGSVVYAGIIYKSFKRQGRKGEKEETKKTIVFCSEHDMKQLQLQYPHFEKRVQDYNWESFPLPNETIGETWDLHISGLPNDFTVRDAEKFVTDSLKCLLPQKNTDGTVNYTTDFSPRSRETGEIHGYGKINFSPGVDHERIKLCKLIVHNTRLCFKNYPEDKRMVTCVWHRVPKDMPTYQSRERFSSRVEDARGHPTAVHVDLSKSGQGKETVRVSTH